MNTNKPLWHCVLHYMCNVSVFVIIVLIFAMYFSPIFLVKVLHWRLSMSMSMLRSAIALLLMLSSEVFLTDVTDFAIFDCSNYIDIFSCFTAIFLYLYILYIVNVVCKDTAVWLAEVQIFMTAVVDNMSANLSTLPCHSQADNAILIANLLNNLYCVCVANILRSQ